MLSRTHQRPLFPLLFFVSCTRANRFLALRSHSLRAVASTGARALVYECYKAANADGMLHAKETGAIDQVAKALGVDATTQHALQALVKAEHHLRMRVLSLLFPHSPSHTAADGFNFGHGALFWSAKGTTRVLLKLEELTAAAAAGNIGGAGSAASGGTDAAAAAGASAPESKASDKGRSRGCALRCSSFTCSVVCMLYLYLYRFLVLPF